MHETFRQKNFKLLETQRKTSKEMESHAIIPMDGTI